MFERCEGKTISKKTRLSQKSTALLYDKALIKEQQIMVYKYIAVKTKG